MSALAAAAASGVFVYLALALATGRRLVLPRSTLQRPRISRAQLWLHQAGLALTPRQFWTASGVLGLLVGAVVVLATATPVVALVPAISAALLPRAWFARERERRLSEVQRAWPDGLRELSGAITAGMSLPRALTTLAASGPDPLRKAFARFAVLARMLGVVPALETIREELADPVSDRVLEVLVTAHERGGRIVLELLRDLAEDTAEDLHVAEEMRTAALEQKINGRAVFVLPWLVLLLLTATPGHYREYYSSRPGLVVVIVAGLLSLLGLGALSRLARDPVEPRVLVGSRPGGGIS